MIDGIAEINACAKIAKATGARVVVVNDSRIYGKAKPHRVYSENEYAELDATSPSSLAGQLMRTRETTLHSVLKNSESTVSRRLAISLKTGSSTLVKLLDAPKIMPVLSVVTVDSLFFKTECKVVSLVLIS